tara:strand:+ start:203 stop:910 length:708 start_codon:yes stop_codon:yes gene_type:complete
MEFNEDGTLKISEVLKKSIKKQKLKKINEDIKNAEEVSKFKKEVVTLNLKISIRPGHEVSKFKKEDKAIILDFLPKGYDAESKTKKNKPLAQAVGINHLPLLELVPKKKMILDSGQEVYLGKKHRLEIHHIAGKIPLDTLTEKSINNLREGLKGQNRKDIIISLAFGLKETTKQFKIIKEVYTARKDIILCNMLPVNSKYIEEFFKRILKEKIEIRSQLGMLREEGIIKGRKFQI